MNAPDDRRSRGPRPRFSGPYFQRPLFSGMTRRAACSCSRLLRRAAGTGAAEPRCVRGGPRSCRSAARLSGAGRRARAAPWRSCERGFTRACSRLRRAVARPGRGGRKARREAGEILRLARGWRSRRASRLTFDGLLRRPRSPGALQADSSVQRPWPRGGPFTRSAFRRTTSRRARARAARRQFRRLICARSEAPLSLPEGGRTRSHIGRDGSAARVCVVAALMRRLLTACRWAGTRPRLGRARAELPRALTGLARRPDQIREHARPSWRGGSLDRRAARSSSRTAATAGCAAPRTDRNSRPARQGQRALYGKLRGGVSVRTAGLARRYTHRRAAVSSAPLLRAPGCLSMSVQRIGAVRGGPASA